MINFLWQGDALDTILFTLILGILLALIYVIVVLGAYAFLSREWVLLWGTLSNLWVQEHIEIDDDFIETTWTVIDEAGEQKLLP